MHGMADVLDVHSSTAPDPVRSRASTIGSAVAIAALIVTTCLGIGVGVHYLHAAPLRFAGSIAWAPPDSARARSGVIGPFRASVVPVRRARVQSFYFAVHNPTSVTQTVLGLPDRGLLVRPDSVGVSASSGTPATRPASLRYDTGPVSVHPGQTRYVRYTVRMSDCWSAGRIAWWSELDLTVRVGAFTRTEHIRFGGAAMALHATRRTC